MSAAETAKNEQFAGEKLCSARRETPAVFASYNGRYKASGETWGVGKENSPSAPFLSVPTQVLQLKLVKPSLR